MSLKRNKMKQFLFGCVVVFLAGFLAGCGSSGKINQLEKQNQDLQAQVDKQQQASDFDLQAKCSSQAQKVFQEGGYDMNIMDSYTNHWNKNLNKCFVLIMSGSTTDGVLSSSKILLDALEGKAYGDLIVKRDKKIWEQTPLICEMIDDGNQSNMKVCNSEAEFDNFADSYMNN